MSTIQDTVFGLYHMFVASKKVTNTEHSHDAHLLLRRMVTYLHNTLVRRRSKLYSSTALPTPHIPNISTFEGVLDLFMLCIIMELGDLVNPLAYKKKHRHGRKHDYDRLCTIHARGLSRDLRHWWCARYMFFDPERKSLIDGGLVFEDLLSQHIAALISYKTMAEEKDVQGEVPECTADVLTGLLKKHFPYALRFGASKGKGFEWAGPRYVVKARAGVLSSYTRCRHYTFFKHKLLTKMLQAVTSWASGQPLWTWTSYTSTTIWLRSQNLTLIPQTTPTVTVKKVNPRAMTKTNQAVMMKVT